ncbi:group III truncated hemoglobin [Sphingobacterium sp. E70]|uniref:group III truncated hemoglobin n=1 Tax=Sphingobacterium sp. E70 TaxID=2853439 RepID=UPI00211C19E0|nr:group III truncated hemoglobin [Sphingobacterium sp. E70]ULT27243.1 group III truncated hemoglobin [Sphingobacterium sp. E70]
MKQDIQTIADIKILVDQFYSTVRQDNLLGPIFQERIQDNWGIHLEKMYRFWQTILLDEHTYFGSPFPPHIPSPLRQNISINGYFCLKRPSIGYIQVKRLTKPNGAHKNGTDVPV